MVNNQQLVGSTNLGKTNIYDDLNINNERTTIESSQVNIKDNIVTINSGETSNKVTSGIAGIEIDRGSSSNYKIIFDEQDFKLKIGIDNNLQNIATEEYVNSNSSSNQGDVFFELDENGDIMIK
ncbi:hypothetical protein ACTQX2_00120 [Megamonas funiformis]|uniref:hypothetical protein n=1 Tax=Megamonas funiformis TaxID=437897 RepID=UPI003F946FB6